MAKKKRDESEAEEVHQEKNNKVVDTDTELEFVNGDDSHEKKKKKKKRDIDIEQPHEREESEAQVHGVEKKKKNKKKKLESELEIVNGDESHEDKKNKKKKKKRDKEENKIIETNEKPTVSIALPGSIIDNAQSLELATRLAGQIARAATIFRIDEVVIFDNKSDSADDSSVTMMENSDEDETGAAFLIRILNYLETPQYLRKALFGKHNSLRVVGLLPPLDAPHHLRKHEWGPYREGVTLKEQAPNTAGTLVDVGLTKVVVISSASAFGMCDMVNMKVLSVVIDQLLEPGIRVTVAMGTNRNMDDRPRQVVSSSKPREEMGMYWGYKVRYAPNISSVFKCCPHKGGYDHLIGTSEHGIFVKSSELTLPSFRHLLIAFGGLAGLEESIEEDNNLKGKKAQEIFDSYLNVCPNQGSRTIRTEEAIFISLQYFQEPIDRSLHRYSS